jgi:DNA-binding beta-propeller fold protein YncE
MAGADMRFLILFATVILTAAQAESASLVGAEVRTNELFTINPVSGEITATATTASTLRGLTYDFARDRLFGLGFPRFDIFEITLTSGALTVLGSLTGIVNPVSLAFDPVDEIFYVTDTETDSLFLFDPADGQTQAGPRIVGVSDVEGLAFDPTSGVLYGVAHDQNKLVTIDRVSGVAIALPVSLPDTNWRALAFDPDLDAIFLATSVAPTGDLWRIDLSSNELTRVGPIGAVQALTTIPEPPTASLLLVGLVTFTCHLGIGRFPAVRLPLAS